MPKDRINWSAAFCQFGYDGRLGIGLELGSRITHVGGKRLALPLGIYQLDDPDHPSVEIVRQAMRDFSSTYGLELPIYKDPSIYRRLAMYNMSLVKWDKLLVELAYKPVAETKLDIKISTSPLNIMKRHHQYNEYEKLYHRNVVNSIEVVAMDGIPIPQSSVKWWQLGSEFFVADIFIGRVRQRIIEASALYQLEIPTTTSNVLI